MKKRVCINQKCKKEFVPVSWNQKLCPKCTKYRVELICPTCGKKFKLNKQRSREWLYGKRDTIRYCSRKCAINKISTLVCQNPDCKRKFKSTTANKLLCPKCEKIRVEVYCSTCGKKFKLNWRSSREYLSGKIDKQKFHFCSTHCMNNNKKFQEQCKNNYKEKTGYEYSFQNPEVQEKIKKTNRKKLGYDNPFQSIEVQRKANTTYKKRTGYNNPAQNPEVQRKMLQTYKTKTGYNHPSQNPEIKKKKETTYIKNYGTKNYSQTVEAHQKRHNFGGWYFCSPISINGGPIMWTDSHWETLTALFLAENGILDEFQSKISDENSKYTYIADFVNKKLKLVIEVKGRIFRKDEENYKRKLVKKLGYKDIIFRREEVAKIEKWLKNNTDWDLAKLKNNAKHIKEVVNSDKNIDLTVIEKEYCIRLKVKKKVNKNFLNII